MRQHAHVRDQTIHDLSIREDGIPGHERICMHVHMNNPRRHPLFLNFSFWFATSSSPHYCPASYLIARCSLAGAQSPSFGYCNVNCRHQRGSPSSSGHDCNRQEAPETSLAAASVLFVSLAGAAALLRRLSVGMPFLQLLRRTPTVEVGPHSKG